MLQTNDQSGTTRAVRASPVGPAGAPHFEYLEQKLVSRDKRIATVPPLRTGPARARARSIHLRAQAQHRQPVHTPDA